MANELMVVGIGPGDILHMTGAALAALEKSDLIVGYTVYVDLVRAYFPEKETYTTQMRKETERIRYAIAQAKAGKCVAVVSSGDSGIYGMAGLVYELAKDAYDIEISVVPGVTAAASGAALLGAPLMHDFATISLSDALTPWEWIEKRLRLAAEGDFVICLYNPASKRRKDTLKRACDILLEQKAEETLCAVAHNIGRAEERAYLLPLTKLRDTEVGMFDTVFIGNSQTREIRGKMVTPRGYVYE